MEDSGVAEMEWITLNAEGDVEVENVPLIRVAEKEEKSLRARTSHPSQPSIVEENLGPMNDALRGHLEKLEARIDDKLENLVLMMNVLSAQRSADSNKRNVEDLNNVEALVSETIKSSLDLNDQIEHMTGEKRSLSLCTATAFSVLVTLMLFLKVFSISISQILLIVSAVNIADPALTPGVFMPLVGLIISSTISDFFDSRVNTISDGKFRPDIFTLKYSVWIVAEIGQMISAVYANDGTRVNYFIFIVGVVDSSMSLFRIVLESVVLCWGPRRSKVHLRTPYLNVNRSGVTLAGHREVPIFKSVKYFPFTTGLNEVIL